MTSAPTLTTHVIASVTPAKSGSGDARGNIQFEKLTIGQNLKLQVLRHLERERYEVMFGGRRHVVDSRVKLEPGTEVEARVEAKGEKLELRYLDAQRGDSLSTSHDDPQADGADASQASDPAMPPWLGTLAAKYRVALDAQARDTIAHAASQVGDPALMTRGGLFLQKLAQRVSPRDLDALYRALSVSERPASLAGAAAAAAAAADAPFEFDNLPDHDDLATTLADALDARAPDPHGAAIPDVQGDAGREGDDDARRALRLLNLQDEGSVAWRYGTLPLLVGGRLVELDLVMFRERESHATRGSLRRLVMTLDTTHFGRVRVEARAVDSRLIVKFGVPDGDAVSALSAYGADVRAAIESLGWSVDEVRYELDAPHASAAQAVIEHVLSAGTVDREL